MAGSRRWFKYEDDRGLGWAVELDESKYETGLGFEAVASEDTAAGRIIRGNKPVSMRYVLASGTNDDDETVRQKFYIGSNEDPLWVGTASSIVYEGTTYSITGVRGERYLRVPEFDTGLTDGDVDPNFAAETP